MNYLRTGFLERHRKRLHEAIDIVSPLAKKACPGRGGGLFHRPCPSQTKEVCGTEAGPDAAVDEGAPDEKSSPTPVVPPSWEILKGVSCFTDTEAPSTKMPNFFPLTKRVSSRNPKERDRGAASRPACPKEREGQICHSKEGVGDEVSECSDLEDSRSCLAVVMSSRHLLVFIFLTSYDNPNRGQTYFRGDDCIHAICKSEKSVTRGSPGRALQAGVFVMERLVCTYMGNNMASLMGNEILSLETNSASARSNPNRMASYSALLFNAGNPSRMACSSCSPVGNCSSSPTPNPDEQEALSTCKVHHSALDSTTKSSITCPFMDSLTQYSIPYSLNSMAHWSILPDRSGLYRMLQRGWSAFWQLSVHPVASAFFSTRKKGRNLLVNRAMNRPSATSLLMRHYNSLLFLGVGVSMTVLI
ncbi:hypothetical protein AAG906_028787 [Vitis piasezkii]